LRTTALFAAWLVLLTGIPADSEIIDRIAISVGTSVITTSDVDQEIRMTAFLNGLKPDFSTAAKHEAADRLVEQTLVRRELELSRYPVPDASAAIPRLEEFQKSRYPTEAAFQSALAEYGLTEQALRDEFYWQLTLLRFIEVRFRPAVQVSDRDIQEYFDKKVKPVAEAAHPGDPVILEDYRAQIEDTLTGQRADVELDNWLKETRGRTAITMHEDALQ